MTSIADGAVHIQTSSESVPSTPSWFGEVVLLTAHLRKHDILSKIAERVSFAHGLRNVYDFPSSSPRLRYAHRTAALLRARRPDESESKKDQCLRYNGAAKEVVCFS